VRGAGSSVGSLDAVATWIAALGVLVSPLLLFVLGPLARWPEPVVLTVVNETDDLVLVDIRSWDGALGVAGPVAETLAAGATTTWRHWTTSAPCIRVIDPSSGSVAARLVASAPNPGDTVRVRVRHPNGGTPPVPSLSRPCPPEITADRVRIGLGWYFEPGNSSRILRERILHAH